MSKCEHWYGVRHSFSQWKEFEKGQITNPKTGSIIGEYLNQERVCNNCNYKQIDKQVTLL